jgi:acyl dehydratase
MHHPDYARSLGFAGGIVPGVDVYAYLTRPVVDFWGLDWLEGGGMDVRFLKPVCDGDLLTIEAQTVGDDQLELEARQEDGEVCATGSARLYPGDDALDLDRYQPAPLPAEPPPADEANFRGRPVLGSLEVAVSAEESAAQLREVGEQLELYARHRIVHPGHLLRFADRILLENFSLPPWMHVSSSPRHFAVAHVGEPLSVRANLVDLFERKGHRFVQLDVLILGPSGPVARVMPYTAIYRPAFLEKN